MAFSVAMCSYNGARHLTQQLMSVAGQSTLPSELIVCDDRSTDETRAIVEAFRATAPFAVHMHLNETRVGVTENFSRAIARCRGDVIALCDQDDVWYLHKLSLMNEVLSANARVGAVFSDAEVVDDHLRPLGYRSWQSYKFGPRQQRAVREGRGLDLLIRRSFAAGATLAFRSSFKELLLPIPANILWSHDRWIALLIAAVADLEPIRQPLVLYRRHLQQLAGAPKPGSTLEEWMGRPRRYRRDHYEDMARCLGVLRDRLAGYAHQSERSNRSIAKVEGKMDHAKARANLPERRLGRLPPVLRELVSLRYHRHSSGMRSAIKDVVF